MILFLLLGAALLFLAAPGLIRVGRGHPAYLAETGRSV